MKAENERKMAISALDESGEEAKKMAAEAMKIRNEIENEESLKVMARKLIATYGEISSKAEIMAITQWHLEAYRKRRTLAKWLMKYENDIEVCR